MVTFISDRGRHALCSAVFLLVQFCSVVLVEGLQVEAALRLRLVVKFYVHFSVALEEVGELFVFLARQFFFDLCYDVFDQLFLACGGWGAVLF